MVLAVYLVHRKHQSRSGNRVRGSHSVLVLSLIPCIILVLLCTPRSPLLPDYSILVLHIPHPTPTTNTWYGTWYQPCTMRIMIRKEEGIINSPLDGFLCPASYKLLQYSTSSLYSEYGSEHCTETKTQSLNIIFQ